MQGSSKARSRSSPAPRAASAASRRSSSRSQGARVVVNDLGTTRRRLAGATRRPRARWWRRSEARAARPSRTSATSPTGTTSQALIKTALDTFGDLHILVNNAGFCRDPMIFNMSEEEFDAVIRVHLKGHFCTMRFATAYWRDKRQGGGRRGLRPPDQHVLGGLHLRLGRPAELRGGQGRHRRDDDVDRAGAAQVRRDRQRDHAARAHAHERRRGRSAAMFAKPAEGFDVFAPENVAPLVGYLASPEAAAHLGPRDDRLGQGRHRRRSAQHRAPSSSSHERWTVESLAPAARRRTSRSSSR